MFRLADGRDKLYQWDSNIKLLVDENFGLIDEVHFASRFSRASLSKKIVVENSVSYVVIPNILLTKSYDIFVYAYVHGDDGNYTKFEKTFEVISRPKPSSYVYTETDVLNYLTLSNRIDLLSSKIDAIPSGKDGITPTIGENGNWYLGDTDTGNPSRGEPGQDGADGKDGAPGAAGADGHTPVKGTDYFTAADKQEIAEAAAGMVSIPDKLPNPNALTFSGAVTEKYDGSAPVTVHIPSSGEGGSGGGALPNWRLIKTISISSEIASYDFNTDDNGDSFALKEIMLAGTVPAYSGYIYIKPLATGSQNSIWPTAAKDLRWWSASVSGILKTMLAVSNASVIWPVDKDPVCANDTISRLVIGASSGFKADGTMYVYGR